MDAEDAKALAGDDADVGRGLGDGVRDGGRGFGAEVAPAPLDHGEGVAISLAGQEDVLARQDVVVHRFGEEFRGF